MRLFFSPSLYAPYPYRGAQSRANRALLQIIDFLSLAPGEPVLSLAPVYPVAGMALNVYLPQTDGGCHG